MLAGKERFSVSQGKVYRITPSRSRKVMQIVKKMNRNCVASVVV